MLKHENVWAFFGLEIICVYFTKVNNFMFLRSNYVCKLVINELRAILLNEIYDKNKSKLL